MGADEPRGGRGGADLEEASQNSHVTSRRVRFGKRSARPRLAWSVLRRMGSSPPRRLTPSHAPLPPTRRRRVRRYQSASRRSVMKERKLCGTERLVKKNRHITPYLYKILKKKTPVCLLFQDSSRR